MIDSKSFDLFLKPNYKKLYEILKIAGIDHSKLYTDDSYQVKIFIITLIISFNSSISILKFLKILLKN